MYIACLKHHYFRAIEKYAHGIRFLCRRCGQEYCTGEIPEIGVPPEICNEPLAGFNPEYHERGSQVREGKLAPPPVDFVMAQFTVESTQKTIPIQRKTFHIGRDSLNDFIFDPNDEEKYRRISRNHATFTYENDQWYLSDDESTNGTWLNGLKLERWKKYPLAEGDSIDLAHVERLIFNNTFVKALTHPPLTLERLRKGKIGLMDIGYRLLFESGCQDYVAFKIGLSLFKAFPLYLPVQSYDSEQDSEQIHPSLLVLEDGLEVIPLFTSEGMAQKVKHSTLLFYEPEKYIPILLRFEQPTAVDPFNEYRLIMRPEFIREVLLPILEDGKSPFGWL